MERIMERGWLIEKDDPAEPEYLTFSEDGGRVIWTDDHMRAMRFARGEDAEAVVAAFGVNREDVRVCEHGWG